MREGPRLSLVISTYNKPRELELALRSTLAADSREMGGLEVVVADDGSTEETGEAIRRFAARAPFDVLRVRQPDRGFRLAAIRNRAVRRCRGEILVFFDGDTLLHPDALRLHSERCEPGRVHVGSRCFLDAAETARLLEGAWSAGEAFQQVLGRERWRRRRQAALNLLYRLSRLKTRPKLVGGNCAVHRSDLERVNGFDERFVGWGLEDDDLARRLRRVGVRIRDGTLDCLVLHLHHPTHPSHRPSIHHTRNYRYFHRGGFLTRCRQGLTERKLRDVSFLLAGKIPAELASLPAHLGAVKPGQPPEVLLIFGGEKKIPRRREAEVALSIPDLRGPAALGSLLEFLEEWV